MSRKRYPPRTGFLSLLLAMALALTGVQMAMARAQPVPAGQIVICSGMGLVTVMVDADGEPVSQSHVCPDGLLTLFSAMGGAWEVPAPGLRWLPVVLSQIATQGQGRRAPASQARDPPVLV